MEGLMNGVFFVKYLYSILEPGCSIPFPEGIIWNPWVLSKVSFFA